MTWTFKLSDGGITFTDGRIDMIGIKEQVSKNEVQQRTIIRFLTQRGQNLLHPFDGFDSLSVFNMNVDGGEVTEPGKDAVIEGFVRSTLFQDDDISAEDCRIVIKRGSPNYVIEVDFHLKARNDEMLKFVGELARV